MGKSFDFWVYTKIYCVGEGIMTLMSISEGLGLYIFCRKMETTWPMSEEVDEKVFSPRQSRNFIFLVIVIEVLFSICTLTWRVNNCVSRQGKDLKRRNENNLI